MRAGIEQIQLDVSALKQDVSTLKQDVATLKVDVSTLKLDVATLKVDMGEVKMRLRQVEMHSMRPDPNWATTVETIFRHEAMMERLGQRLDRLEQRGAPTPI
jgi:regulator of replication initiation timing